MARNVQLIQLVQKFREETGASVLASSGLGQLPAQQNYLRRTQKLLALGYDWPHLRVDRTITLQAGQRFYDFPSDIDYSRVEEVNLWINGQPSEVERGIGSEEYRCFFTLCRCTENCRCNAIGARQVSRKLPAYNSSGLCVPI